MNLKRSVHLALRSPALMTAASFGAGGVGFALANLLLARLLPENEYGYLSLSLSLVQLGLALGPFGLEVIVNRRQLGASTALLRRAALTSSMVGIVMAGVAWLAYGMTLPLAVAIALAILGASLNRLVGALFQSRQDFGVSLFLTQIHNWILLVTVPIVILLEHAEALPVVLAAACGYAVVAYAGWHRAWGVREGQTAEFPAQAVVLREGLAIVGLQLAMSLFFQLDRLLIAKLLSISDLALYAVVASVAGAPFRMLQIGASYSLLPRLRACKTVAQVRRIVGLEAAVMLAVCIIAAVGVVSVMPWIASQLLAGRYAISMNLVFTIVAVGFVRVWSGFATASVQGLGSVRHLAALNGCGWIAVGVAALCATFLRSHGLIGMVYGLGAGWTSLATAASVIALNASRARR